MRNNTKSKQVVKALQIEKDKTQQYLDIAGVFIVAINTAGEVTLVNKRGYPDGLSGQQIPQGARILAVADAYDAMTSERPYRKAMKPGEARDEIARFTDSQFDPSIVNAFLEISAVKPGATRVPGI